MKKKKYDPSVPPKKHMLSLQLDAAAFEPATDDEKAQQIRMRESVSFFKDGMRRLSKNTFWRKNLQRVNALCVKRPWSANPTMIA